MSRCFSPLRNKCFANRKSFKQEMVNERPSLPFDKYTTARKACGMPMRKQGCSGRRDGYSAWVRKILYPGVKRFGNQILVPLLQLTSGEDSKPLPRSHTTPPPVSAHSNRPQTEGAYSKTGHGQLHISSPRRNNSPLPREAYEILGQFVSRWSKFRGVLET